MKKNDLNQTKGLSIKELSDKAKLIKKEIAEAMFDKNMNKLKDLKVISKKRKDLAQVLTVMKQKELLEQLELRVKSQDSSKEPVTSQKTAVKSSSKKSTADEQKGEKTSS